MIIIRILSHESRSQKIWHPPQKFLECAPLPILMTVAELKQYLQMRGVTVNGYLKPNLFEIAQAVEKMVASSHFIRWS